MDVPQIRRQVNVFNNVPLTASVSDRRLHKIIPGKTYEEAIANIKEAIEGWLEVMESKQPLDRAHLVEVAV